jgi:hypothetical protein
MYDRIIYENETYQWRVTINVFREVEYFHLRKYILDFDEKWVPIKEGVSFPLDLNNITELFTALVEILSLAESKDVIAKHFSQILNEVYNTS